MQPWLFIYVFSFWFLDETWLFLAMLLTGFLNFTHLLFGSHWTVNMMPNKIEILEQLESHCISCSVSLSFVYFTSLTNRDAFVYPKHFSNNKTNAKKLKQPFWSPPPTHTLILKFSLFDWHFNLRSWAHERTADSSPCLRDRGIFLQRATRGKTTCL